MDKTSFDHFGVDLLQVSYGFALFEVWEES